MPVKQLLASALLSTLVLGAHAAPAARPAGSGEAPLTLSLVRGGEIATDPVVNGTLSYVPTGRVLATWDFRNPASPLRVATSAPSLGVINGIARHGDYLYASWRGWDSTSGLTVYSLADPRQPELVAEVDYVSEDFEGASGVAVANGHLYLFDSENGVFVSDLADPAQPVFTRAPDAGLPVAYSRVSAFGNLIYASGRNFIGGTIFDTYDVSTPTAPVKLSSLGLDGLSNFSVVPGHRRAVSVGWQFNTWDLSVPGEMTQRSSTEIYGALSAALVGNRAYTFGFEGLQAWDIGNLSAPRVLGRNRASTLGARHAASMGRTLLLPTATDLLHAYNVRPAIPGRISTSWLPGGVDASDVAMHDGRAVMLQVNYGLTVNDPQTLAPQARFEAALPQELQARDFEGMDVSGDIAYLTAWGFGLIAVDLSTPQPREIGRLSWPYIAVIDVEGDYAYVTKSTNGNAMYVVDIADPAAPSVVWGGAFNGQVYRLQVSDGYAYLAEGPEGADAGGLRIFDLANPAAPVQVARLDDDCSSASDLSIDEAASRLYLACSNGMQVIDIAQPAEPEVIGRYDAGGESSYNKVAHRGNRAWFSDVAGLHEIDVSNPAQPVRVQLSGVGRQGMRRLLPLDDGRLLALAGGAGVHVFAPGEGATRAKARTVSRPNAAR